MTSNSPWRSLALAVVAALLAGGPLAAVRQERTLAELARQEQERRKAIKGLSKVYTDHDLKKPPPRSTDNPDGSPAAVVPVVPEDIVAAALPAAAAQNQAAWKKKMDDAREEVRRDEMFVQALQSRVSSLTSEFVAGNDPFERAKLGDGRQKAVAELERVKADLERAKKLITTIEEDARVAGVPPGWIR